MKLPKTKYNITDYVKYFRSITTQKGESYFSDIVNGWITSIEFESDEYGNITFYYILTDYLGCPCGYRVPEQRIIKRVRKPKKESKDE